MTKTENKLRLLVKITDKKWADKLQDGSVFMRSLHDYGSWSAVQRAQNNDNAMKNGIQSDINEGVVRRVNPKIGDSFFNGLPSIIREHMSECRYIDENLYQYCKIYCMYGLTYLTEQQRYEQPDNRLKEFGDTAVIILDYKEFLRRIAEKLYQTYGDNINLRLDEIFYYPPDYYDALDEFCKLNSYAWQNEIRLRVKLLNEIDTICSEDGKKCIIQDTKPITIEIGNIRDISVQIPVQDLINLNLPSVIIPPKTR